MKKLIASAALLIASGKALSRYNGRKKTTENIDEEKINRNIIVVKERLDDRNLTMCQRQEYEKALDGLEKSKK